MRNSFKTQQGWWRLLLLLAPLSCAKASDDAFMLDEEPVEDKPVVTSHVEVGVGYNTADSHRFGQYSGLNRQQLFGIGSLDINRRADYDSDSGQHWRLLGTNLGLDSRRLKADYGLQGRFKLGFEFDQLPNNRLDDARTPFTGIKQANLKLPDNWQPARTTDKFSALQSSLQTVNISTRRRQYKATGSWLLAKHWSLGFDYKHEKKVGTDTIGGAFGISSFLPFSAILPKPVDQDTDNLNVKLTYADPRAQFELGYSASFFNNQVNSLSWQNPYSMPRLAAYPQGQGRLALEPDNVAHQIRFSAGWRFNPVTRLSAAFSYGKMLQNNRLLPFTVNPQLQVSQALPSNKSHAQVDTLHANLNLSTRLFRKLQLRTRYRYDERDNQTRRNRFFVLRNDSENQLSRATSTTVRYNVPYGRKQHQLMLDAGYRILRHGKLSAGYTFVYANRKFSQATDTQQHSAHIKLSVSPLPTLNSWLKYEHVIRKADNFKHDAIFKAAHSTAFLNSFPTNQRFQNDPLLRQFNLANRRQHKIGFSTTYSPVEALDFNLVANYSRDDYNQTVTGLKRWHQLSTTLNVDYALNNRFNTYSFFTYERIDSKQQGFQHDSNAQAIAPRNAADVWQVDNLDQVYTAGTGFRWQAIEDTLALRLDYTVSYANTQIDPRAGSAINSASLPALTTRLHSLALRADYTVAENTLLRLNYRFESFKTQDFAQDGIRENTVQQVLSLGNQSPDYHAHVFGLSVVYSF